MSFTGKFKLKSSENFDEYMKKLGVGLVLRKLANVATPVQEIKEHDSIWNIKTTTTFKTTDISFKLGEEFEEERGDGKLVKTIITKEDNKLIQNQNGDPPTTLTREFSSNEMKMTLVVDDVTCIRVYERI